MAQIVQHQKSVILELKDVSKAFAPVEKGRQRHGVLDGLNLRVQEGEFVTIVGASGCGKSTLLNLVAGLEVPDSGSISAKAGKSSVDRVVIFQEGALFPWLTVADNVAFGLKVQGVPKEHKEEVANRFIKMVGLEKFASSSVYQLSGGMKQRVAIARALALDPQVLLMDEPFAALDEQTRELLHEQLLHIHESTGKTILFVTHNISEAVQLGDRVVLLSANSRGIKKEIAIDYPKPRDIDSPQLRAIKRELLNELQEDFKVAKSHS